MVDSVVVYMLDLLRGSTGLWQETRYAKTATFGNAKSESNGCEIKIAHDMEIAAGGCHPQGM